MEHLSGGDHSGSKANRLRLVFLPLPAMGHIVTMVEFAKRLLHFQLDGNHQLEITFLLIQSLHPSRELSSYIASMASSSDTRISFINLPAVGQVPAVLGQTLQGAMTAFIDLNKPLVRSALREVMAGSDDRPLIPSAIVLDLFCTAMIDVAYEVGIQPFVYSTCNAGFLGLMLSASTIASDNLALEEDEQQGFLSSQFTGKSIDLPGLSTAYPVGSMPVNLINPKNDAFAAMSLHAERLIKAKGIIINTFHELEPSVIEALEKGLYLPPSENRPLMPPLYTVGPVLLVEPKKSSTDTSGERHECIRWLDQQPARSVVFLCFGSMGSFTAVQAAEIATGLEQGGQRFLWIVRSPPAQSIEQHGRIPAPKDADLEEILPDGFLERTKSRGLVWPSFAPQTEILAHDAVGGFVTHCGWNSSLESIWYGIPMVAWPLYAEQHYNAFELVTEIGVALEVCIDRKAGNVATAEEVKRAVTALMGHEGTDVRKKSKEMKDVARSVFQKGGSSFDSICKFLRDMQGAA